MKRSVSYKLLPWPIILSGCIVLVLRFALYTMENQSSLLPARHPLYLVALLLAAVTGLVLAAFVLQLKGANTYESNFPFSRPRAQGSFLAGLLMFPMATGIYATAATTLELIWAALATGAAICFIASGYLQLKGEKPHFLLYAVICLFYVCHMVCSYQTWSGNPQVEDYIFSLFACIFLSLFAYQKSAFSVHMGSRQMLIFSGLMATFFCIAALAGVDHSRFFAASGIWAISNLCRMDPPHEQEG